MHVYRCLRDTPGVSESEQWIEIIRENVLLPTISASLECLHYSIWLKMDFYGSVPPDKSWLENMKD